MSEDSNTTRDYLSRTREASRRLACTMTRIECPSRVLSKSGDIVNRRNDWSVNHEKRYLLRGTSVAQIPHHYNRGRVVLACSHESCGLREWSVTRREMDTAGSHIIWMPSNIAHTSPSSNHTARTTHGLISAIRKGNDLAFSAQIPHDSVASAAGTSQDILHLQIPSKGRDLVQLSGAGAWRWRIRFGRVFEIPYIHLSECGSE